MNQPWSYVLAILLVVLIVSLAWYFSSFVSGTVRMRDIIEFIGIVISVFSFVIACYFAVLAVTAYGKIRDIEEAAETIKNTIGETEARSHAFGSFVENSSLVMSEIISELADKMKEFSTESASDYVGRLHLIKHRLDFLTSEDVTARVRSARDLINGGDTSDLEMLRKFFANRKDTDSRELTKQIEAKLRPARAPRMQRRVDVAAQTEGSARQA